MFKGRFYMYVIMKYLLCNMYIYKFIRVMDLWKCLELYGYIVCKIMLRRFRE